MSLLLYLTDSEEILSCSFGFLFNEPKMPNLKICRVCVKESPVLYSLSQLTALDPEGNEVSVQEMLAQCCSAKLQSHISLWICSSCSEQCTNAYNFVKLFQKNNEHFKNLEKRAIDKAKQIDIKVEIRRYPEIQESEENGEDEDIQMVDPLLLLDEQNNTPEINSEEPEPDGIEPDELVQVREKPVNEEENAMKPFQCTDCPTQFTAQSSLRRHLKKFHSKKHKPVVCTLCGESWSTNKEYEDHYLKDHYCHLCKKEFRSLQRYKDHLSEAHQYLEKRKRTKLIHQVKTELQEPPQDELSLYKCPSCGTSFFHRHRFVEHLKAFHSEEIIVCEHCDELFSKPDDYVTHYDFLHYKTCTICETNLQTRQGVIEHQRKHLTRPCYLTQQTIKCSLCTMQGKYMTVVSHMRSYHSGAVDCYVCNAQFVDVDSFLCHFAAEHRIQCNECNIYCVSKRQYHAHINSNFTGFKDTSKEKTSPKKSKKSTKKRRY